MVQIFGFDEIEKIRSMPYDKFFGEMGITKEQKQERIEFSNNIEDDMRFLFMLILIMQESGEIDADKAADQFEAKLLKWIPQYVDLDSETKTYISDFCLSTAQVTADRPECRQTTKSEPPAHHRFPLLPGQCLHLQRSVQIASTIAASSMGAVISRSSRRCQRRWASGHWRWAAASSGS